jgi:hypothetical protein
MKLHDCSKCNGSDPNPSVDTRRGIAGEGQNGADATGCRGPRDDKINTQNGKGGGGL